MCMGKFCFTLNCEGKAILTEVYLQFMLPGQADFWLENDKGSILIFLFQL